jgi:HK97 family phage major capsid protein
VPKNIAELKNQKMVLITQARGIQDQAEKEKRDLTSEERANIDKIIADGTVLSNDILTEERLQAMESSTPPGVPATMPSGMQTNQGEQTGAKRPQDAPEYRSAFKNWQKYGFQGLTDAERRALSSTDTAGGYMMTPTQVRDDLIVAINNNLFFRRLATIITMDANAKTIGVPTISADPADPDWTAEVTAVQEDSTLAFGRRELTPYLLSKFLKVSDKLLRSVSNVENIVNQRMAYKFSVAIEKACMTGTGSTGPLGVFVADANGIPTGSDVTTAGATAIVLDDIVKVKYGLPQQYWAKAAWMFNPTVALVLALIKEGGATGQYIWRESLRVGEPATLLGHPVYLSSYAPNTVTTGLYTGILGDFSYYWMVDSLQFQLKRLDELYAINSQVGFIGRWELDAAPVLGDAFRRMKQA